MSKNSHRQKQRRPAKKSNLGLYIVLGVVAVAVAVSVYAWKTGQHGGAVVGAKAPDITVRDLQGNEVQLASVDRPVLVTFWQTTCPACQAELRTLQDLWTQANRNGQPRWTLMPVNLGEPVEAVKAFMDQNHYTFPVYVDPAGSAGDAYNVLYIPANFFIDASHRIRYKNEGGMAGPDFQSRLDAMTR